MPFKSEKQRRFLWASHPDIAKRWAHKYPESNKNLPMYATENTSDKKAADLRILQAIIKSAGKSTVIVNSILTPDTPENAKTADSKQEQVDIPRSEKPVYAGEEREKGMISSSIDSGKNINESCGKNAINELLQKLSVVLSPAIEQTMENMNAENEGRVPRRVGKNTALKQYPQATPQIPLPMGMQQAQAPQQAQTQAQTQPASPTPVGAGQSSATTDPIKFHSGLSASGIINGNAALSAPNTVNTKISVAIEKWAASSPAWQRAAGKNDEGGLNAKGRASYNRATGGNLKAPVTESNPKGERNKRQNSFCSRMCGMKSKETGAKTKSDPDSRINKALRKWNCKCSSATQFGVKCAYDIGNRRQSSNVDDRTQNLTWQPGTPDRTEYNLRMPTWKNLNPISRTVYFGKPGTYVSDPKPAMNNMSAWGKQRDAEDAAERDYVAQENQQPANAHTQAVDRFVADIPHRQPGLAAAQSTTQPAQNSFQQEMAPVVNRYQSAIKPSAPQVPQFKRPGRVPTKIKVSADKYAQEFDPALSRDAENAIMHGTGLVGSGVLGSVAGIPVSSGLESLAQRNNLIPNSEKNPWMHLLAQGLIRTPIIAGGMLGTRLYDNYILRPHMKRELARKKQEDELRQQLAISAQQKQAGASLARILGTMVASTGGGLLIGGYPGWRLERASQSAGNHDFVNFLAGKTPIAMAGASSAALFNHLYDKYEAGLPKKQRAKEIQAPKIVQYLVH